MNMKSKESLPIKERITKKRYQTRLLSLKLLMMILDEGPHLGIV